jgi:hypothetical protein
MENVCYIIVVFYPHLCVTSRMISPPKVIRGESIYYSNAEHLHRNKCSHGNT